MKYKHVPVEIRALPPHIGHDGYVWLDKTSALYLQFPIVIAPSPTTEEEEEGEESKIKTGVPEFHVRHVRAVRFEIRNRSPGSFQEPSRLAHRPESRGSSLRGIVIVVDLFSTSAL